MRLDDGTKYSLGKRKHVHARWERRALAVIEARIRSLESDAETSRSLTHALQSRQSREYRTPLDLVGVKHQNSAVTRENPYELREICECVSARDVLEHPRRVGKSKAVVRKDGEVGPLVQSKGQAIEVRIEPSRELQHRWRDVHPHTARKDFSKRLTDATWSAPKVESLPVAIDIQTARLDMFEG